MLNASLPKSNFGVTYSIDSDGSVFDPDGHGSPADEHGPYELADCPVGLSDIDNRVSDGMEIWELDFDGYRKWFPAEEAQTILHNYGHPDFQMKG
jgi:hypothetical protein